MGDDLLPISSVDLCLFIQFLSRSLKSQQSIVNYVHGLKTLHKFLDISFPPLSTLAVRLTLKGVSKKLCHVPHQASPITPALLIRLHSVLDVSRPLHCVYWTLFLFMFYLFARKSQFIPTSINAAEVGQLVQRQHVTRCASGLLVSFRWTKTRQAGGAPLVIPLVPVHNSPLCPVQAYNNMCRLVPAAPVSPLFILPPSHGVVPIVFSAFHKVLHLCLSVLGIDHIGFSSHSFRRGGATFAFSVGVPGELIQSQGDWSSECYKLYLDLSVQHCLTVARSLSHHLMSYT